MLIDNKNNSFQKRIVWIMSLVFLLVLFSTFMAYRQFSFLFNRLVENTKPNVYLVNLRALSTEIGNADNQVKSFRLTEDTSFIRGFYKSAERADKKLQLLMELEDVETHYQDFDSLESLVDQKFESLNDLLNAPTLFRVDEALNQVLQSLNVESSTNTRRLSVLNSLFSSRSKAQSELRKQINEDVVQLQLEERSREALIKAEEKRLIRADQRISKEFYKLYKEAELMELKSVRKERSQMDLNIQRTNLLIAVICGIIGLFLLGTTYTILNFINANNRYRAILRRAKLEAENLAETKQRFLANISHEIRTPLHAVIGFIEQLSDSKLSKDQREKVNILRKSSDHLLHLVNDVLDYSKIQAGKLSLEEINFELRPLLEELVEMVRGRLDSEEVEFQFSTSTDLPKYLRGDPYRLRQIILNLLSNAFKFTDKGFVNLSTDLIKGKGKKHWVRFTIEDTGIGMTTAEQKQLFAAFEQANSSISRNYGGSGLGLNIVKQLIKLQGGELQLESKKGKGTRFTVILPFKTHSKNSSAEGQSVDPGKLSKQLRSKAVLVVDDEEYNRKLIAAVLNKHKIEFFEAKGGKDALKILENENIDIVLMDIHMPELDGIQTTKAIRKFKDKQKAQVPIIALTAAVGPEERKLYLAKSMQEVLSKPFKEVDLLKCLIGSLGQEVKASQRSAVKSLEKKEASLDLAELRKLSNGDRAFFEDMLLTFIKGSEEGIASLHSSLENKDNYNMAEYAHRMCSPCRHLGAYVLLDHLKRIEESARTEPQWTFLRDELKLLEEEYERIKTQIELELANEA